MTSEFHADPVHGAKYQFKPLGDDGVLVETVIDPGGGLPKHHHPIQDEIWWVTSGEVQIYLGDSWRPLRPEDGKVDVPRDLVHGIENRSAEPAELSAEAHPALDLEAFLIESAAAARDGLIRKGGIPRSWRGAKWAVKFLNRYGDQVVLAFPPRPLQKLTRPLAKLID